MQREDAEEVRAAQEGRQDEGLLNEKPPVEAGGFRCAVVGKVISREVPALRVPVSDNSPGLLRAVSSSLARPNWGPAAIRRGHAQTA